MIVERFDQYIVFIMWFRNRCFSCSTLSAMSKGVTLFDFSVPNARQEAVQVHKVGVEGGGGVGVSLRNVIKQCFDLRSPPVERLLDPGDMREIVRVGIGRSIGIGVVCGRNRLPGSRCSGSGSAPHGLGGNSCRKVPLRALSI